MRRRKRGTLKPHTSSIVLHLAPILAARNILHPFSYLVKIGIVHSSASKMLKGGAVQINFRQLTLLCTHLNCTPNDLFALRELTPNRGHQLQHLQSLDEEVVNPTTTYQSMSLAEIKKLGD